MPYLPLARNLACIAALTGAIVTAPAHALVITGGSAQSDSQTGAAFVADLTYNASLAELTIELTNTTLPGVGGFLTAFVLNNPGGITSVSLDAPTNWNLLGLDDDDVNGAPFGQFDFGATTFANANSNNGFEGGGNPDLGLAPNATGTFVFTFGGTGLDMLTAESFLSALSVPPGAGEGTRIFAARFRGLDVAPGSDKVAVIPEASTYAALFAGIGLLAWRLRRRLPL